MKSLASIPAKVGVVSALAVGIAGTATAAILVAGHPGNGVRVLGEKVTATTAPNAGAASPKVTATTASNKGGGNGSNGGHSITVTGSVSGSVVPGKTVPLVVTVTNPNNQNITVTSVQPSVGTPNKSGCISSWFATTSFTGSQIVAKNSSSALSLTFAMLDTDTNQNACKSATVPLTFTATATG